MLTFRRSLSCVLLLPLTWLAGCALFYSDAWQGPSPLSGRPPPPEGKQERQGGFTVLVDAPGQPTAARVAADIGTFARGRGFVRVFASPALERYVQGDIGLDIAYRATEQRIVATLHGFSSRTSRRYVDGFYQDFHQAYAGRYGGEDPVFENDYADAEGALSPGGGGGGRRGGR